MINRGFEGKKQRGRFFCEGFKAKKGKKEPKLKL